MEFPDRARKERYFDPDFYQMEVDLLWPRVWQMACRLEEQRGEASLSGTKKLVDAGDPCSDHQDVDIALTSARVQIRCGFGGCHAPPRH